MSQPSYVRNAKRKWKTLKRMLEQFRKEHGRDMTTKELSARLNGGH